VGTVDEQFAVWKAWMAEAKAAAIASHKEEQGKQVGEPAGDDKPSFWKRFWKK
jgi:hypothetical protein